MSPAENADSAREAEEVAAAISSNTFATGEEATALLWAGITIYEPL